MKKKRRSAASIVLGNKLWILGGEGDINSERTSEYFSPSNGSIEYGPDLPIGLCRHAAIKINDTTSMLIGGVDTENEGDSAKTWFYSHLTEQWIDGPDLLEARSTLAVGLIMDSMTQELLIVVTGGYEYSNYNDYLKSIEILNLDIYVDQNTWKSGKT